MNLTKESHTALREMIKKMHTMGCVKPRDYFVMAYIIPIKRSLYV